jgi:transposase
MTQKTSSTKRRKYDADFQAEVLKMVASGKPVAEISRALGIGENIIYRWKSKQRQESSPPDKAGQIVDVWQQVDELREKLRQTELERDILKKALAIFSRMT